MKSAKALVPILVVVLLVCAMALSFAWFAETMEEARVTNTFTLGDTNYVVLSDESGAMVSPKYFGEEGFRDDGTPYPAGDADETYVGEYHINVRMIGNRDMTLTVELGELTVLLSEYANGATVARMYREVLSGMTDPDGSALFGSEDELAPYIGTATKTAEGQWELAAPEGGTAYLYTTDGTSAGRVIALRLDEVNANRLFRLTTARVDADGVHGGRGSSVTFDFESGEVSLDSPPEHTLCLQIEFGYADEQGYGEPFAFSDTVFQGSGFSFTIVASAT